MCNHVDTMKTVHRLYQLSRFDDEREGSMIEGHLNPLVKNRVRWPVRCDIMFLDAPISERARNVFDIPINYKSCKDTPVTLAWCLSPPVASLIIAGQLSIWSQNTAYESDQLFVDGTRGCITLHLTKDTYETAGLVGTPSKAVPGKHGPFFFFAFLF